MHSDDLNRIGMRKGNFDVLIGLCFVLLILSIYGQVIHHDFIDFDDDIYVKSNRQVREGTTLDNLKWSIGFNNEKQTYWHPLTWLSHMLDVNLFGLYAGGHLMTNVCLHIINTLLLFTILRRWSHNLWPAVMATAIFAVHPLCVETVAWVASRKNLLSSFFWLLTLQLYFNYTRNKRPVDYFGVLLSFCIGLMAKPMLVTLPFVLLLLDYWPLKRLESVKNENESHIPYIHLIVEKIPFLILALLSVVVSISSLNNHNTFMTQDAVPMELRIGNALVSYIVYIGKLLWPFELSVFYPFPGDIPIWQSISAFSLLAVISLYFTKKRKEKPYLIIGWLWYLGTLVPVIGLVQAGLWPAIADRFTYIPFIGLYIIISWSIFETGILERHRNRFLIVFTLLVIALTLRAGYQTAYWKNSKTLFKHAIELNDKNIIAHNNIGKSLINDGQPDQAVKHYRAALSVNPKYVSARKNLGTALAMLGEPNKAIYHLYEAIRLDPNRAETHYNLGNVLARLNQNKEAVYHYEKALSINPNYVEVYNNLGNLFADLGRIDEAVKSLSLALKIDPHYATAHNNLGNVLVRMERLPDATRHYRQAIKIRPTYSEAYNNLGVSLKKQGKILEARMAYKRALALTPDYSEAHYNLALALISIGQIEKAVAHLTKAVQIKPDDLRLKQQLDQTQAVLKTINEEIEKKNDLIADNPYTPMLRVELGDLYKKKGDSQSAVIAYQKALDLDRSFIPAWHKLGIVYAIKGEFDDSVHAFEQVTRLSPDSSEACYWLAQIFAVEKRIDGALSWLEKAINRGFSDWNRIHSDPKLNNIRQTTKYKKLIIMSAS